MRTPVPRVFAFLHFLDSLFLNSLSIRSFSFCLVLLQKKTQTTADDPSLLANCSAARWPTSFHVQPQHVVLQLTQVSGRFVLCGQSIMAGSLLYIH